MDESMIDRHRFCWGKGGVPAERRIDPIGAAGIRGDGYCAERLGGRGQGLELGSLLLLF